MGYHKKMVRTLWTGYAIGDFGVESCGFVVVIEAKAKHTALINQPTVSAGTVIVATIFLRCQGRHGRTACFDKLLEYFGVMQGTYGPILLVLKYLWHPQHPYHSICI
jgi:hypothetical protein